MDEKGAPPPAYAQPGYPPPQQGYPPAQPGYPQAQPGPAPVVGQPTVMVAAMPLRFGEAPVNITCQFCQAQIVTATRYESGLTAWLAAGIFCVFGLWCGCCFIPFCVDACKDVEHTCPNCQRMVGKMKRLDI